MRVIASFECISQRSNIIVIGSDQNKRTEIIHKILEAKNCIDSALIICDNDRKHAYKSIQDFRESIPHDFLDTRIVNKSLHFFLVVDDVSMIKSRSGSLAILNGKCCNTSVIVSAENTDDILPNIFDHFDYFVYLDTQLIKEPIDNIESNSIIVIHKIKNDRTTYIYKEPMNCFLI